MKEDELLADSLSALSVNLSRRRWQRAAALGAHRQHYFVCSGRPELKSDQRALSLRHRPMVDSGLEGLNCFDLWWRNPRRVGAAPFLRFLHPEFWSSTNDTRGEIVSSSESFTFLSRPT
jgi:hypothetical protein